MTTASEASHSVNEPARVPPVLTPPLLDNLSAQPPAPAETWGFWATMGLGIAIITALIVAQCAVAIPFVVVMIICGHKPDPSLANNGLMLSLATVFSAPVTIGFCWLFAQMKAKHRAWEYLALRHTGWRSYVWGFGGLAGIWLAWMGMVNLFNIDESFMIEAYRTAGIYPVLWFAIIIAAPIMEELLFRGFFFQGILRSRAGAMGAVLIPSVFWAAMHVQYSIYVIIWIFLFGIVLGILRLKSGSILPGVAVHVFSNLLSTIQVALLVSGRL